MTRRYYIDIPDEAADRVEEMAAKRGIEIAELFRQGIGRLALDDVLFENGAELRLPLDNPLEIDATELN